MNPLVSIITPTWKRNDLLLDRCIPSVVRQTYPAEAFEHIVVSDGPDPGLEFLMRTGFPAVRYFELSEHETGHIGNPARLLGLKEAKGDYIAYLDDDDAYRPEHVKTHIEALKAHPSARWSASQMDSHSGGSSSYIIGRNGRKSGDIGTPMVVHEKSLLDIATWGASSETEDWDLFSKWNRAGAECVNIDEITVDVWPSRYHGGRS